MTSRQQWTVVGVLVLVLGLGLGVASRFMQDELFPVFVGSRVPDFKAKELGSPKYKTLADYRGQVMLLNVWATWCESCRMEIPSLERLQREYGAKGLRIVAVSTDDYVSEDSIRRYANNLGVTFEILHDPTHGIERVLQTTAYPETFVVGPEGTIRKKIFGPDNWDSIGNRALVAQLLGLPTPRPATELGDDQTSAPVRRPVPR